jgi:hypothetical protein
MKVLGQGVRPKSQIGLSSQGLSSGAIPVEFKISDFGFGDELSSNFKFCVLLGCYSERPVFAVKL